MPSADSRLRVVILAGGIGSRFWPASTPTRPKPLLSLSGTGRSLIAETVERALGLVTPERVAILTGSHLVSSIRKLVPELTPENFWVEPEARGTGPALAWAAHRIHSEEPDAIMVSLHSDHLIRPEDAFQDLIPRAARFARDHDVLLTIAARPDRPETGYGYMLPGESLEGGDHPAGHPKPLDAWKVSGFLEKPGREEAERYVAEGYAWNTGIFLLPVSRLLEEIRVHAPEIGRHFILLDQGKVGKFFAVVPHLSVDECVLERTERLGAVWSTFEWDDVGGWEALARTLSPDQTGNRTMGEVHAIESSNTLVWAEDGPVVLFGVDGLVVVRSGGVTLVSSRARAPELKRLVEGLPPPLRDLEIKLGREQDT